MLSVSRIHVYSDSICNAMRERSCRWPASTIGRGVLTVIHVGSRMISDVRILINYGTEHVVFSPTNQTSLAPSAKRREVFCEPRER